MYFSYRMRCLLRALRARYSPLAVELKAIGYNPVIFALKNGPLTDEAQKAGITVVADRQTWLSGLTFNRRDKRMEAFFNSFGTILVNTLDAVKQCRWLHLSGSRLIAWIHEAERTYEITRNRQS